MRLWVRNISKKGEVIDFPYELCKRFNSTEELEGQTLLFKGRQGPFGWIIEGLEYKQKF